MSNFLYVRTKTQKHLFAHLSLRRSRSHRRTRSLGLFVRVPYCNQEEWLKKLEDISPANEAEGKFTTSASRTKLLENGRYSETSTTKESSADVDVDDVDLKISSF